MPKYEFIVYLANVNEITEEAADALFEAGCDDASPASRDGVVWSTFHREAPSLEHAIRSAISDVNKVGFQVQRIELDAEVLA